MDRLKVPILYYHLISVPPRGAKAAIYVEPARFARQLRLLRWMGYSSISFDGMLQHLEAGTRPAGRRVMITFDDGHADNCTAALPILREEGFTATVFVVAGAIGGRLKLRSGAHAEGEPIVSAAQIRELVAGGIDVQSHGMTHANFAQIADEQARQELADSRAILEDITQRPVPYFAFPYGSFRPKHLRMLEDEGYRAAVSTVRGRTHAWDERYCLKRLPVHHERSLAGFAWQLALKPLGRAQQQLDRLRTREKA